MKPKKILLLAIFSGLLTTGVFYIFMQQNTEAEVEQPVMVQVVSAAADVGENVQLTDENLQMVEMRESEVHPAAIKDKTEAVGEFTANPLVAGEVLLGHHIEQKGDADIISKKVTDGHRAVSISVDYVKSVSNMVEPEDRVDVILTPVAEGEEVAAPAEILFEDVKVLAVGQRMEEKTEGEAGSEYVAVTLEMTQGAAVEVIDASNRGTLQLVVSSRLKAADGAAESVPEGEAQASELPVEETADATEESASSDIIVLPERAHVRNGPSLDADVLTVVDAGDELVTKNEEAADADGRIWMHVETKSGTQGWISSRIIKMENE
ncbi:Flp pilus assembly protein CpaB [Salinicoccus sp. ID82-1]|uniref:Flp pilus assembly protein CpaB n=1 Tax=Salinicoccus sp. ID82-1 TaxID=2820269 RepID=UPI001F30B0EA|nr:Flp pilus assembly protein CpaB [Salinicoccus sp. ID82-1]MCG1009773.1 Flp pilus assembly protein CpaB [Salinicoccus sp. ID82-1]